jgi:predicted NBD/HSP70 family sugar kinase
MPAWVDGWKGLDLPGELNRRLDVELVWVDDTARAVAMAAQRFGAAQGKTDFLYLFLGNGIGSGIFVNGRLYTGSRGIAGEVGHITVDEQGPWCSCGNRGCLEVMASTSAVLRRAGERLAGTSLMSTLRQPYERNALTLAALIEAARARDKLAFQILDETGTYVGGVLATALNVLGLELVVLGGPLAQGDEIILDAVRRQVNLRALQHISKHVHIVCDDQGELAGAHGAALLALDGFFGSERHLLRLLDRGGSRP